MPKYTNKTNVETYLNKTITGSIDYIIDSVEKYIDNYTGRNFVASQELIRVYSGDNTQNLLIDDAIEINKVEIGNDQYGDSFTEVDLDTDYKLLPANYEADGVPITKIHLRNSVFGVGVQNHRITGKWGFSEEAPSDIVWVATFLASSVYQQGQGGNLGGVASERIGEYSVSFKTDKDLDDFEKVKDILNSYKIYNI